MTRITFFVLFLTPLQLLSGPERDAIDAEVRQFQLRSEINALQHAISNQIKSRKEELKKIEEEKEERVKQEIKGDPIFINDGGVLIRVK